MISWFSKFLDKASNFLATRKGLLPIIGIGLVLINFLFASLFPDTFIARTNLFMHIGITIAIIGQMLAWAL